jgi:Flp pilus assembly pilin Flp
VKYLSQPSERDIEDYFGRRQSRAEHDWETMSVKKFIVNVKALRDTRGQDLIEYALMAGFVAVAAGAVMPGVADSISSIFSQVESALDIASTQGS